MRPVGVMKRGQKRTNFHASNWLFAQTTHVDVAPPPEILHSGSCPEAVIYFQFYENRFRGLGAVGRQKSPSRIDKAHCFYNSL